MSLSVVRLLHPIAIFNVRILSRRFTCGECVKALVPAVVRVAAAVMFDHEAIWVLRLSTKKETAVSDLLKINPAATYSPSPLRDQYHRRWRA